MSRMKRARKRIGTEFETLFGDKFIIKDVVILKPEDKGYFKYWDGPEKPVLCFVMEDRGRLRYEKVPSSV